MTLIQNYMEKAKPTTATLNISVLTYTVHRTH